jgi:hypothetical protein
MVVLLVVAALFSPPFTLTTNEIAEIDSSGGKSRRF